MDAAQRVLDPPGAAGEGHDRSSAAPWTWTKPCGGPAGSLRQPRKQSALTLFGRSLHRLVPVVTHSRRSKRVRASSQCWVWGFFRSGWRILKLWARARLSPPMMSG